MFALLEAASLENDNDLQDMFARLLANATTEGTGVEDRKAYVSIIQEFKPLDARLLEMISSAPTDQAGLVYTTSYFPNAPITAQNMQIANVVPPPEVERALWNLVRLACIQPAGTVGGGSTVAMVHLTQLGRALIEACTIA